MPMGIIGPGSGLGVSAVVPQANGYLPIAGEGGHVTMAAANDEESAVLELMRRRYDHVSAERAAVRPRPRQPLQRAVRDRRHRPPPH